MSSNYPPGVTGNEYAIAGPDKEWVAWRHCPTCGWEGEADHQAYEGDAWWHCPDPIPAHEAQPLPVTGRNENGAWVTTNWSCALCGANARPGDHHPASGGCGATHDLERGETDE
jgi:hypothetical protein